jgi:hypothetical protein
LPANTKATIAWQELDGDYRQTCAAEAGAMIFQQGGNAVDAACAMLAAPVPCGMF